MSRPRSSIPRLCRNSKGYRFAKTADGCQHWFGHESDPASRQKYAAFLTEQQQSPAGVQALPPKTCSVNEVCLAFLTKYATRYRRPDGNPSAEVDCFKSAIRILKPLFGETPAAEFGPVRLRVVRDAMIAAQWSRNFINKQIRRVRMMFRFAVSLELIPASILAALDSFSALSEGETSAPDHAPRAAVSEASLNAVRLVLTAYHRDICDLLMLTGARPGEVMSLTGAMIERTGDVWRANLRHHKTAKRGKSRILYFNISAQAILMRHGKADPQARLFPTRRDSLSRAFQRACKRAKVEPFVPHALRHTVATLVTDDQGLDAAQQLLGHSTAAMTRQYSKASEKLAVKAAKSLG